jgi:hypothetical protein
MPSGPLGAVGVGNSVMAGGAAVATVVWPAHTAISNPTRARLWHQRLAERGGDHREQLLSFGDLTGLSCFNRAVKHRALNQSAQMTTKSATRRKRQFQDNAGNTRSEHGRRSREIPPVSEGHRAKCRDEFHALSRSSTAQVGFRWLTNRFTHRSTACLRHGPNCATGRSPYRREYGATEPDLGLPSG